MDTFIDPHGEARPDRRRNTKLRGVFHEATQTLHTLFHEHDDWAGSSEDFLALRLVHERYPELSAEEVRSLVTAIGRKIFPEGHIERLTA